jgi:XTP/dITP diphosphohydrolase
MAELWIATGNKGKLGEFKILFKELPEVALADVHSQGELKVFSQPPENGATFLENARIKARALKAVKPGNWIVADDSGLEVDCLGNLPGIHSARYAGPKASDSENVSKLLKMMQIKAVLNRNAQFVCQMVIFTPEGEEWSFSGVMKGTIGKAPKGDMGFGYDPVFIPEGQTQSLAELGLAYKNQFCHRALAAKEFIEKMKSYKK